MNKNILKIITALSTLIITPHLQASAAPSEQKKDTAKNAASETSMDKMNSIVRHLLQQNNNKIEPVEKVMLAAIAAQTPSEPKLRGSLNDRMYVALITQNISLELDRVEKALQSKL